MGVGAVSFAQIVKACEPVFAAVVGILVSPMDIKPTLAYAMLIPIVGCVGIACIKEGKGVDINYTAFMWASLANMAAALKGKLGGSVTKSVIIYGKQKYQNVQLVKDVQFVLAEKLLNLIHLVF